MTQGGGSEKTVVGRDSVESLRSFLCFVEGKRSRLVRTLAPPTLGIEGWGETLSSRWMARLVRTLAPPPVAAWLRPSVVLAVVGFLGWLGAGAARAVAATTNGSPGISLPAFLARSGFPTAPAVKPMDGYVGSDACRECHRDEHASWHASYHRTMTQKMTPEAVLGRFDGAEVVSAGFRYRLTKEGDTYFSEGPDPDQIM